MLKPRVLACLECPLGEEGQCSLRPHRLVPGSQLWAQGDERVAMVFVKDGLLGLTVGDAEGRELFAGVRGPRSLVGLETLSAAPARATVVALVETTVCSGSKALEDAPLLLRFALEELSQVLRDVELRAGTALTRVARFLLRYRTLLAPGKRAPFSMRHLARLLDVRPETLSRCLKQLRQPGFIDAQLSIVNRAALQALSDGEALPVSSTRAVARTARARLR